MLFLVVKHKSLTLFCCFLWNIPVSCSCLSTKGCHLNIKTVCQVAGFLHLLLIFIYLFPFIYVTKSCVYNFDSFKLSTVLLFGEGRKGGEERTYHTTSRCSTELCASHAPHTQKKNVLWKREETFRPAIYLILFISSTFAKGLGNVMLCSKTCIMESQWANGLRMKTNRLFVSAWQFQLLDLLRQYELALFCLQKYCAPVGLDTK